ncbi:MAG: xanthine dehydrogenase family protein subunit M [Thermoprotei archaeon]|nr:MAG: xanthine dehydrogenase family protein subunit M [Thermoprotei archaeon]
MTGEKFVKPIKPKVDINKVNTHIIPFEFEYFEPRTVKEAVELLTKYGGEAKILAGGTDLIVRMKQRFIEPKYIINIKKIKELNFIEDRGDYLAIGAATKLREIEKSGIVKRKFEALYEAVRSMAGVQIRNMATIGGNLCNASPAADTAPPLLVFEAKLKIVGPNGERVVPINEFFLGPGKTVLKPNEILTEIQIPYQPEDTGSAFIKIARVAMDLAKVNVAVALRTEGSIVKWVRIALGAVAPTPIRAYKTEEFLVGKELNEETLKEAAEIVKTEVKPITDIRSTAEYRREVSGVIVKDALLRAYERISKG